MSGNEKEEDIIYYIQNKLAADLILSHHEVLELINLENDYWEGMVVFEDGTKNYSLEDDVCW